MSLISTDPLPKSYDILKTYRLTGLATKKKCLFLIHLILLPISYTDNDTYRCGSIEGTVILSNRALIVKPKSCIKWVLIICSTNIMHLIWMNEFVQFSLKTGSK